MVWAMIRTVLAEFAAYCRAPRLIAPGPCDWRRWGVMVGVYLAGLVLAGGLVGAWQRALHLPLPDGFTHFSPAMLVGFTVVAAPVGEEIAFRGWLTGRLRALWLLAVALVAAALLAVVEWHIHDMAASLGVVACVPVALVGWLVLRRRDAVPGWFARVFPLWFYLSLAVFALLHLTNYPRLSWAMVPMVLPQAWAGLVFGYVRMRDGLGASMLAHASGNAVALATALLIGG
jgi:membrane protease YdiL (CAAX protease family)